MYPVSTRDMLAEVAVSRKPVRDIAYSALRRAILEGSFKSGQHLIESELATRMGVSRTPVREAIHKLELEGFVRRSTSRGVVVTRVTQKEIEDVFAVRSLLEPHAVALAVAVLTDRELTELESAGRRAARYAESPNARPDRISELNMHFYDLLYSRCPNEQLRNLVFDLRDRFMFLDAMLSRFSLLDLEQRRLGTRRMRPILNAVRQRDRRAVERLVKERLLAIERSALAKIRAQPREIS